MGTWWERACKALGTAPGTLLSVSETLPLVTNAITVSSGTSKKGIPGSGLLVLGVCPSLEWVVPNLADCVTGSPIALPLNSAEHPCSPLPIDRGRLRPKRKHRALIAERACQKEQASSLPTSGPPSR